MNRSKNNELGFGTIEILLVLVAVSIIGCAGWFVWSSQKHAANLQTLKTASSVDSACKETAYDSSNSLLQQSSILIKGWGISQDYFNKHFETAGTPQGSNVAWDFCYQDYDVARVYINVGGNNNYPAFQDTKNTVLALIKKNPQFIPKTQADSLYGGCIITVGSNPNDSPAQFLALDNSVYDYGTQSSTEIMGGDSHTIPGAYINLYTGKCEKST